jgi:hypothetical protein
MIIKKIFPVFIGLLMLLSIGAAAATTNSTATNGYNVTQVSQSAGVVKSYVDTNCALPKNVTVGNKTVSNAQFLYLMTQATTNVANNNKSSLAIKLISPASSPSETITTGTFTESQYLNIASRINSYINTNNRLPNYVTTSIGTMQYSSLICMFSNIMIYYKHNNKLPATESVQSWYAQTLGPSGTINGTMAQIAKAKNYTVLGSNQYGEVLKLGPFGTGKNKVAIIVGVDPQEVQAHIAMLNAIGQLSSSLNNVQIYVYDVIVYNGQDYTTGRTEGQNLAYKYVVPNINTSYKLVLDVHGNRGFYTVGNVIQKEFVMAPSNGTSSLNMANKLRSSSYTNGTLGYYYITDATSPPYVTLPLAKKGIPTLIFEQYLNQVNYAQVLYEHALQVLKAINATFA